MLEEREYEHFYYSEKQRKNTLDMYNFGFDLGKAKETYCIIENQELCYTECRSSKNKERPKDGINFEDHIYLGCGKFHRVTDITPDVEMEDFNNFLKKSVS
jgi:hypothetical protein